MLPLEMANRLLLMTRLPMIKLAWPSLVTVTLTAELVEPTIIWPKSTDIGAIVISGTGPVPVPFNATFKVFSSGSLEGMVRLADCGPMAAGVKTIVMLAESPAGNV
jgi:hypothetical protein